MVFACSRLKRRRDLNDDTHDGELKPMKSVIMDVSVSVKQSVGKELGGRSECFRSQKVEGKTAKVL